MKLFLPQQHTNHKPKPQRSFWSSSSSSPSSLSNEKTEIEGVSEATASFRGGRDKPLEFMDPVPATGFRFEPNVASASPQKLPRWPPRRRRHLLALRRRVEVRAIPAFQENKGRPARIQVRGHDRHPESVSPPRALWPRHPRRRQNWLR